MADWIINGESGASVRAKLNTLHGYSPIAMALGAIVVDGGAGYSVNDILTAAGGTGTEPTFTVTSVDGGGAITDLNLTTAGSLSVIPADPTATTVAPAGGAGATLTISWSFAPVYVGTDSTSGFGFDQDGVPLITASGNPVAKFFGDEGGGPWSSYLIVEASSDSAIQLYVGGIPDANGFNFGLQSGASFNIYSDTDHALFRVFSHGSNNNGVNIHADATTPKIQANGDALNIGNSHGYQILIDTDNDVNVQNGKLIIPTFTPTSAADTGKTGTICWDSGFIYVCIDTDTWVRTPLTTWI